MKNDRVNCSSPTCSKCLRGLLTLDYHDKLDEMAEVYDVERYKKNRQKYLSSLVKLKEELSFARLYDMFYSKYPQVMEQVEKEINSLNEPVARDEYNSLLRAYDTLMLLLSDEMPKDTVVGYFQDKNIKKLYYAGNSRFGKKITDLLAGCIDIITYKTGNVNDCDAVFIASTDNNTIAKIRNDLSRKINKKMDIYTIEDLKNGFNSKKKTNLETKKDNYISLENIKEKIHISIIGSCVLRDIFNSKFVSNYADFFVVDSYFARTAMPSIVGKPIAYDIDMLEREFNWLYFGYNYTECSKSMLTTLENNQSDYILLDFYSDAYYGTYVFDDSYIKGSLFKLKQSKAIATEKLKTYYNFDNLPEEYFSVWCKAFDMFMKHAKEYFPATKFIVNGISGTNIITQDIDGEVIGIQQPLLNIDKLNAFQERMNQYCEKKYNIPVIRFEKRYTLNPNYIFGLKQELVHFHNNYYQDAFEKILKLCKRNNVISCKKIDINLIRNSDFASGTKFWSYSNCIWKIGHDADRNVLIPEAKSKSSWKWIWCDPIEINGDGEKFYTLSFSITYADKMVKDSLPVFGIREFKYAIDKQSSKCLNTQIVSIPATEIEYNKKFRYSYTFQPVGKYIRVAPHVKNDICNIEFSDIQLQRGNMATEYKLSRDDRTGPFFTIN